MGVGSTALGVMSGGGGTAGVTQTSQREEEILAHYPGAKYLAGPWRLRIDPGNRGKQQAWFRREPSESEAKAYEVGVPGCWQEYVPGFDGGIGWYFKDFRLPAALNGKWLRMKFWAIDYFAEVWVNGEKVGQHEGGYTPFEFDVTKATKIGGKNRLTVRVVDPPRPAPSDDRGGIFGDVSGVPGWEGKTEGVVDGIRFMEIPTGMQSWVGGFNFGGIWQPVELVAADPVYISDVFIEPKLQEGAIEAHIEVTNREGGEIEGKVAVVVRPWKEGGKIAGRGELLGRFSSEPKVVDAHIDIQNPHAWSPDDPYLYVAEVSIQGGGKERDHSETRFGLRELSVEDGYFHLNRKRVFIKGVLHCSTYPTTLAYPPTREFAYKEVQMIKEAGFNFSRLCLEPSTAPFLDAADELGLILQAEPPLSQMEDSPQMLERSVREVRELVKRDRNRPSILIWNMINENDPPVRCVREQCQAARDTDPTRLITESAGGPSKYYLPYSREGISYLTEHPYAGAPLAEDVYDYQQTRGVEGQLCFFSEYGYGGMNDLDSVLAKYGANPREYMEDYASHVVLRERRDKAFRQSKPLQKVFGDTVSWREACQTVQADTVRLHSEAMRSNPGCGGYDYTQMFDATAIEIDGLADFWREKRKKAFSAMQEVNKRLLLVVRMKPMNGRIGEEVRVKVTLVNEEQIVGRKRLRVRITTPAGREVYASEREVEAQPWVSVIFEEGVQVKGETGRYGVEATLWEAGNELVRKEEYFTLFEPEGLRWLSSTIRVWDIEGRLEAYLKQRTIGCETWTGSVNSPVAILVTPFTGLWKKPDEYRRFIRLFSWVERGCTAVFLGVPSDGERLLTAIDMNDVNILTPLSKGTVMPFRGIEVTAETWAGQRIGAYAWGLVDSEAGVAIVRHPTFEGIPQTGIMGREYGNVAPVDRIRTNWRASEDTGSTVQIYEVGRGKLILTSLNLLPNLRRDALAEKLLANLVNYAGQGLAHELSPESAYTEESERFEAQGYGDCLKKYIGRRIMGGGQS
jgi:hypothetical protein